MDVDEVHDNAGPPDNPTLEEELVQQFGPGVLRVSPEHQVDAPSVDLGDPDDFVPEDEEDNGEYHEGSEYEENYSAIDLSRSHHHVSDSEEEESNPLRAMIRRAPRVQFSNTLFVS
jgi:hypothetical protein